MSKILTEKRLTLINIVIVCYFIAIYLINLYKLDYVIIGFFGELLTIPFLIAQIVFLILGGLFLVKNKKTHIVTIFSIVLLAICSIITISSFF